MGLLGCFLGDTDSPNEVEAYEFKRMCGHVNELLERERLEEVIGVGHDWYNFSKNFTCLRNAVGYGC